MVQGHELTWFESGCKQQLWLDSEFHCFWFFVVKTEAAFAGPNFQREHVLNQQNNFGCKGFGGHNSCVIFRRRALFWTQNCLAVSTHTFAWQVGGLSSCCGKEVLACSGKNLANIWPCQSQEAVDMDSFKTGISLPSSAASVLGGGFCQDTQNGQLADRPAQIGLDFFRFPIHTWTSLTFHAIPGSQYSLLFHVITCRSMGSMGESR